MSTAAKRSRDRERYHEKMRTDPVWKESEKIRLAKLHSPAKKAKWRKNNPDKHNATCARHRAKKCSAPGDGLSGEQRKQLIDDAKGICSYCGKFYKHLTLDHVIPLDHGGAHDISNLRVACRSCNSSKGTKILYEEWTPPKDRPLTSNTNKGNLEDI